MLQDKIFYLIAHYGYIGIFGALVLGIVGLPVPDEVLMTYSGYLISQGRLSYILTLLVAVVGSFAGMSVSYFIGRKFGYPLLEKHGRKIRITKEKLDHTRRWFEKFGKFALTLGYFIPGVRHLTAYFAGISGWPYRTFLSYAAPGAILWAFTFITLGTYLGKHWLAVTEAIHKYLLLVFVLLVLVLILLWFLKRKPKANQA